MSQLQIEFDVCVLCGKLSHEPKDKHIDFRTGYVEGSGQICIDCYKGNSPKSNSLTISAEVILNTPNDSDLGKIVRELYWKNKNK